MKRAPRGPVYLPPVSPRASILGNSSAVWKHRPWACGSLLLRLGCRFSGALLQSRYRACPLPRGVPCPRLTVTPPPAPICPHPLRPDISRRSGRWNRTVHTSLGLAAFTQHPTLEGSTQTAVHLSSLKNQKSLTELVFKKRERNRHNTP